MAIVNGTTEADRIQGTDNPDVIHGLGGDDIIKGGFGNDEIYGDEGDDYLDGERGIDTLHGGAGNDYLYTNDPSSGQSDYLYGDEGDDTLFSNNYGGATMDGGAGNDRIIYMSGGVAAFGGDGDDQLTFATMPGYFSPSGQATGGAGQDVFRFQRSGQITITDFTVGNAGDSLDLVPLLQSRTNWNGTSNPFATGHLRLVQNGANTDLYWTAGGTGTGSGTKFAILQNVTIATLTDFNLGFSPLGTAPVNQTINGTANAETLNGAAGADVIHGLASDDTINGGGGNDTLYGDDGNDTLDGGSGDDDLYGGIGNDTLYYRNGGTDRLYGEDGDDTLIFESDELYPSLVKSVLLDGGIGNDQIVIRAGQGTVTALGGDGNDTFTLNSTATVTGGAGQDIFRFGRSADGTVLTITDFAVGNGGDQLDLAALLRAKTNWDGVSNPFVTGQAWLIRHGNDTLIQYDTMGYSDGIDYKPLAILQNVDPATLNTYNLGGFANSGPPATSVSLSYTGGSLTESAGAVPVILTFLNASLVQTTATFAINAATTAVMGTDFTVDLTPKNLAFNFLPTGVVDIPLLLNLRTIDDLLNHGVRTIAIDITVVGQVFDNGSDTKTISISLFDNDGTAGDDVLVAANQTDRIAGMEGNDSLRGGAFLDGGMGNDGLAFGASMYGRTGNDYYLVAGTDDYYLLQYTEKVFEAAGEGYDIVFALHGYRLQAGQEIEELAANSPNSTDRIDLSGNEFGNLIVGSAGVNLIDGGTGGGDRMYGLGGNDSYLVDNATDQVFEAVGGGYDVVFTLSSFTLGAGSEVEEVVANYPIQTMRLDLTGNEFANALFGNAGINLINGGAGGGDRMYGFGGNDYYLVDSQTDQVFENAGQGYDTVYTLSSYQLAAGQEIEELTANLPASTEALNLTGNEFANLLFGNAGANRLAGGDGSDTLTGYAGADIFAFDTTLASGGTDRITDFEVGTDKIGLDDAMFTGFTALTTASFIIGASAVDADTRLIYNSLTGALYFDPDGNGAAAQTQFATLNPGLDLSINDFIFI